MSSMSSVGLTSALPRAGVEDWEFCLRAGSRDTLIRDNELISSRTKRG